MQHNSSGNSQLSKHYLHRPKIYLRNYSLKQISQAPLLLQFNFQVIIGTAGSAHDLCLHSM